MALIKMSSIGITAISGKAGGSVYSRNRGGEYIKNFVMPTNTITQARQAVRAVFGALASAWRALTQSERNTWIEQAPNYLRTNAFGDQKQLQPNALFVGQNTNLLNAGLTQINEITAPQGTNGLVSRNGSLFDLGSGSPQWDFNFDLEMDNASATALNHFVLEATPPHNASRRNVKNEYRVLAKSADHSTTPPQDPELTHTSFFADGPDAADKYVDKFGMPEEGDVVSYRVKAINPRTGEVSSYFYQSDVVVNL